MPTRTYRQPTSIAISPKGADKTEFQFRLEFLESGRREHVEFEITAAAMMVLMEALRGLQRKHNIPLPGLRPTGKPFLRLVETGDQEQEP